MTEEELYNLLSTKKTVCELLRIYKQGYGKDYEIANINSKDFESSVETLIRKVMKLPCYKAILKYVEE